MKQYKTLINSKGQFCSITASHNKYINGEYKLNTISVPRLLGMQITTESYEHCFGECIDFSDLEIITVNLTF